MLVSVIVLAYRDEPWLAQSVSSALASEGIEIEVVVVNNGASPASLDAVRHLDGVTITEPGRNLGFAGGVNYGVAHSRGDIVVMLNSDAHVARDAIARLTTQVQRHDGIAGALVLLNDEPDTINSAGNPLHVLGLSWAGLMGRPASDAPEIGAVASASGACMALTRAHWDRLGGFGEEYFAYLEDMDLCWRTHQLGLPVVVLASARCWHHYEYGRTELKNFLIERNRLMFLATNHEASTLAALALPLVALEGAMLALAASQGWAPGKIAGWRWIATHLPELRERRRRVQAARLVPDAELAPLLTAQFTAAQEEMPAAGRLLERALGVYWTVARRVIGRPRLGRS